MALVKIGANQLTSLDEESKEAVSCNLFYEQAKRLILRQINFNCAKASARLVALSEKPPFEYEYYYQLPSDYIFLRYICDYWGNKLDVRWDIQGSRLLTDQTPCYIKYTSDITDTAKFTPELVEAMVIQLAIKLAPVIAKSDAKENDLINVLEQIVKPAAKAINGDESYCDGDQGQSQWINTF